MTTQDTVINRFAERDYWLNEEKGRNRALTASGMRVDIKKEQLIEDEKLERLWTSQGLTWPRVLVQHAPANDKGVKFVVNADGGGHGDTRLRAVIEDRRLRPNVQVPFSALENAGIVLSEAEILDYREDIYVFRNVPIHEDPEHEANKTDWNMKDHKYADIPHTVIGATPLREDGTRSASVEWDYTREAGSFARVLKALDILRDAENRILTSRREHILGACLIKHGEKAFLSSVSEDVRGRGDGYFLVELTDPSVTDIDTAFLAMRPKEIPWEAEEGTDFVRQGEYFFVPVETTEEELTTKYGKPIGVEVRDTVIRNPEERPTPVETRLATHSYTVPDKKEGEHWTRVGEVRAKYASNRTTKYIFGRFETEEMKEAYKEWKDYILADEVRTESIDAHEPIDHHFAIRSVDDEGNVRTGNPHKPTRGLYFNPEGVEEMPSLEVVAFVQGNVTHPEHRAVELAEDKWWRVYHNRTMMSYAAFGMVD